MRKRKKERQKEGRNESKETKRKEGRSKGGLKEAQQGMRKGVGRNEWVDMFEQKGEWKDRKEAVRKKERKDPRVKEERERTNSFSRRRFCPVQARCAARRSSENSFRLPLTLKPSIRTAHSSTRWGLTPPAAHPAPYRQSCPEHTTEKHPAGHHRHRVSSTGTWGEVKNAPAVRTGRGPWTAPATAQKRIKGASCARFIMAAACVGTSPTTQASPRGVEGTWKSTPIRLS